MAGIVERLMATDWSFAKRAKAPPIEGIHPYPAKFIGDIPRTLLDILPIPKGTFVLDPFVGSGTTLVESQRRGLPSVGIDLNPIACLISRVKTGAEPDGLQELAADIVARARTNATPDRRVIPNLDHWFKADVQTAVAAISEEIRRVDDDGCRDALNLCLSSILVRVSNQDSDTRYAAVDKDITWSGVFDAFTVAVSKLKVAMACRTWDLPQAHVLNKNTLEVDPTDLPGKVGIVVTSPPYPNAYEYWLYHKYRMWWLGYDPIKVKSQEIGARAHFFKTNHHTEKNFWDQMRGALKLIDDVMVQEGYACFVIGRSKIHGVVVDNAGIIRTIAESMNFICVAQIERVISASRKSFNLAHANIKTETILVLQKCKVSKQ
ncbi:RNA methyltransferase [Xanthomonas sp. LMG 12460]|nr:RNA methyltransferase [Xanthomonas sp. LMG 12460]